MKPTKIVCIRLDPELHKRVKMFCVENGYTIQKFIEISIICQMKAEDEIME